MFGYKLPRWLWLIPIFLLIAVGAVLLTFWQQTTYTINDNGQTLQVLANARLVREVLQAGNINFYPEDLIQPALDAPPDTLITITRAAPLTVVDGASAITLRTQQKKLNAILNEAGKTVAPSDAVYADGVRIPEVGAALAALPHTIIIQRSAPLTIVDNGKAQTLTTSALTVAQVLAEANVQLFLGDGVTPALETLVRSNMTITLDRAAPIKILVDGQTLQTRTRRKTVGEVLTEVGIALVGLDTTVPALGDPLPTDAIKVIRVQEVVLSDQKPIKYEVQYQAVSDLDIDNVRVVQQGVNGVQATRTIVRYENGVAVSRTTQEQVVQVPAKAHIIGYGTRASLKSVDTADGALQYWRVVRMYATSYSASRAGTPITAPWYGMTRSGKKLTKGMVAIDLNVMPLGTRLYVPGYGFATAEDTGSGVKGKWIDLGYDDWNYESWHSFVNVYFLAPVPSAAQIKFILP